MNFIIYFIYLNRLCRRLVSTNCVKLSDESKIEKKRGKKQNYGTGLDSKSNRI